MTELCRHMEVSTSAFYAWVQRDEDVKSREENELLDLIENIHQGSRETYGSPRVFEKLKREYGYTGSKGRVEKLMRVNGIKARKKRSFRIKTTDSNHNLPIAPDLIQRDFAPGSANACWISDITYINTHEGWLYLAALMDLGTREIVGWAMEDYLRTELIKKSLQMAVDRKGVVDGLIHHSDRGVQYASAEFQRMLAAHKIRPSMSRKGNCYDNAVAESFFHLLKTEHVHFQDYKTKQEARQSIFEWIEVFYNRERIHSSLGYLTPNAFAEANRG